MTSVDSNFNFCVDVHMWLDPVHLSLTPPPKWIALKFHIAAAVYQLSKVPPIR